MTRNFIFIIALVASCVVFFLAGRLSSASGSTDAAENSHPIRKSRQASRNGPDRHMGDNGRPLARSKTGSREFARPFSGKFARAESIISLRNPADRTEAWLRFVSGLDASECEALVAELRAQGVFKDNTLDANQRTRNHIINDNHSEYTMLLSAWVKADPEAALIYSRTNSADPAMTRTLLTSWAAEDIQTAVQWAESNHVGEEPSPWMASVIKGAAADDLKLATKLVDSMTNITDRNEAFHSLLQNAYTLDPDGAREWAMSFGDESLRSNAIASIANELSHTDPKGFADWLLENPGDSSFSAMEHVMAQMTKNDPEAAVAYLQDIVDEDFRTNAFNGVMRQISDDDIHKAAAFIEANPAFATDDVYRAFISRANHSDRALGASSIEKIQDEGKRREIYSDYFRRWLVDDHDAAVAWRNQNELPQSSADLLDFLIQRASR